MNSYIENKINILIKQNDAIYNSLIAKNILFERIILKDELTNDEKVALLSEENEKLKNISKINRPPPEVKISPPKKVEFKLESKEEEEEENYETPKKTFNVLTNMEDIKRAFFNKDYILFNELMKAFNFKYYRAVYKYESDKDGAPEFIAKNLVKGFVRNLDDYRKYLMVCFRCYKKSNNNYSYPSLWIVNSKDDLKEIIESVYDDFIFTEENNISLLLNDFEKRTEEEENCLEEAYVH